MQLGGVSRKRVAMDDIFWGDVLLIMRVLGLEVC